MAAAQRADVLASAGLAQLIGPGPGGHRQGAAAKVEKLAALAVLGAQADHLAALAQQFAHTHAVECLAAVVTRLGQHPQHQARIVGHRIEESRAAEQPLFLQTRRQVAQRGGVVETVVAPPGKGVVHAQQAAE